MDENSSVYCKIYVSRKQMIYTICVMNIFRYISERYPNLSELVGSAEVNLPFDYFILIDSYVKKIVNEIFTAHKIFSSNTLLIKMLVKM